MEAEGSETATKRAAGFVLLLALLPLALACHPHFSPDAADSLLYWFGAQSIAETGRFQLQGLYLRDWAPGTSYLVAIPLLLGFRSLVAGKLTMVACVGLSWLGIRRLWSQEERSLPLFVCLLTAYCPTGFARATNVFSEWPYMALSFLFLLLLPRLRDRSGWLFAALLGVLLGAMSLFRFIGVLGGLAVVATVLESPPEALRDRLRLLARGALVSVVGASIFLAWRLFMSAKDAEGAAFKAHYPEGWLLRLFSEAKLLSVPGKIGDLLFHGSAWTRLVGAGPASLLLVGAGLVTLLGLVLRFRRGRVPSDWYVLGFLILFAFLSRNQQTRYLLPVMPFLLHYLWIGSRALASLLRLPAAWRERAAPTLAGAMLLLFALLVGRQLLVGGRDTHSGTLVLLRTPARDYYQGEWREFHEAGMRMRAAAGPGRFSVEDGSDLGEGPLQLYLRAFSGRDIAFEEAERARFLVVVAPGGEPAVPAGFALGWSGRRVRLFERRLAGEQPSSEVPPAGAPRTKAPR